MRIRIVAGELGGRYIAAPPGRRTRPTAERVREAWFSALGERVAGASVVDLFAGSGALGIEALSRGSSTVHFVEADRRATAVLRRNVEELGVAGRARIFRMDVFRFLERAGRGGIPFDLALADPPYRGDAARRLAERYVASPFAGLLCLEHAPGALGDAGERVAWARRYGDTALTFLRAPDAGSRGDPARGGNPATA